jgi:integrase
MATVKFLIKGAKNPSTILVRFTNGRKFDFKRSTSILCNPKHWNSEKAEFRKIATPEDRDKKNNQLQGLRSFIIDAYNVDYTNGIIISTNWLETTISRFFNQGDKNDLNRLIDYGNEFIKALSNKKVVSRNGKIGVAESTIQKYNTVLRKIEAFERYSRRQIHIRDVDLKFRKDFIDFLIDSERYRPNYAGRLIKFVKTICLDAKSQGIKSHPELEKIRGFTVKVKFVYLNMKEIELIESYDFSNSPYLDNARDWLIIGLFTGQRVSDFKSEKLYEIKNDRFEFVQQKGGKQVQVPVNYRIKEILKKRNGNFPHMISDQKFNEYIKEVCKKVGISDIVEGDKMNPKTNRKEYGKYPKHELVSSHICRRSFATNHYNKLATGALMGITGHSTEKMFLTYIGKINEDNSEQLKKYWDNEEVKNLS